MLPHQAGQINHESWWNDKYEHKVCVTDFIVDLLLYFDFCFICILPEVNSFLGAHIKKAKQMNTDSRNIDYYADCPEVVSTTLLNRLDLTLE